MALPQRHKKASPSAASHHQQAGNSPAEGAHASSGATTAGTATTTKATSSSHGPARVHEPTSWFNEASSSSSSMEALPMRPSTPPQRRPPTSSPISPATSPSSILKYPKPPGSGSSIDSDRSTSTVRGRGKSVSFNDRTSIYNLPGSTTASSNNSEEELWREDVLPKYWRHEAGSPPSTPEKMTGHLSPSGEDGHGFTRTTDGEFMLPFMTPLGIEHIQFSQEELETYNALRSGNGAENQIPSLVDFLRALRGN